MKKIPVIFFLVIMALILQGCSNKSYDLNSIIAKSKLIDELYYEYYNPDKKSEFLGKVWIKGTKYKEEILAYKDGKPKYTFGIIGEKPHKIKKYMFTHIDNPGAVTMPLYLGDFKGARQQSILNYLDLIDLNRAQLLGTEKINGVKCLKIKTNLEKHDDPYMLWINTSNGIPMKAEFQKEGLIYNVFIYQNISIGPINNEIFNVPENAIIID